MLDKKLLSEIKKSKPYDYLQILYGYNSWEKFNYEKDDFNKIIKLLEDFAEYFYHHDGILRLSLDFKEYDNEFKKVFLIKNMKIIFNKFIKDIKNDKEKKKRLALNCHGKHEQTILTLVFNIPLKTNEKLYREIKPGMVYTIFHVEDPYSLRFANEVLNTLNGKGPYNVERRIRIIDTRQILKDYAKKNNLDTEGVFALLPRSK